MKTTLLPALSTLRHSLKNWFFTLLLILCAWPGASIAQAQSLLAVGAWGSFGQTDVPVDAQSGVKAIAAGGFYNVVLKNDGTVVAWGANDSGQVTGTPATNDHFASASPVTLGGQVLTGVIAIAAGDSHTVALKSDGTVVAWGANGSGQVTVPAGLTGVTAIAAGGGNTVALKNDGTVVEWVNNVAGQPTVPAGLTGVRAIAAGWFHTVALKNDGSVVAWGWNISGQVTGTPTDLATANPVTLGGQVLRGVAAIAAGGRHTVAMKKDGTVLAWGDNSASQTTVPPGLIWVTAIAAGAYHTVVLVAPTAPTIITQPVSQTVSVWQSPIFTVSATGFPLRYQWRKNEVDVAGATSATYGLPFAQTNQAGSYTVVVSNSAGSATSAPPAVLSVNAAALGTVVAWGDNRAGTTDIPVAAQSGVTAIAAGGYHGLDNHAGHIVALKNDGTVVAWGLNDSGQTAVPPGLSNVTAIAAGGYHSVALKNDGSMVAWGDNDSGQVTGTPGTNGWPEFTTASPVTLGGQVLTGVKAVAAGGFYNVVLKNDGTVVAWGANDSGQVTGTSGTNGGPDFATASPVTLAGQVLSEVTAIAAGGSHTVALKNDGSLVAWGANYWGQVTGIPTTNAPYFATASPVTLEGQVLSNVMATAAGDSHTVALKNDGTVVAWGYNGDGQVTGTRTPNYPYLAIANPVTLGGQVLSGVTAIAAGRDRTVALRSDGTVATWGGTIENPVTLGGQVLSGVTAIGAGLDYTVVLIGTGLAMPVSLNWRPSGNNLVLSWSTNAVGLTLQSTLSLAPPVTWIDSTNPRVVIGTQFTVTNIISDSAQFYRLKKL